MNWPVLAIGLVLIFLGNFTIAYSSGRLRGKRK